MTDRELSPSERTVVELMRAIDARGNGEFRAIRSETAWDVVGGPRVRIGLRP